MIYVLKFIYLNDDYWRKKGHKSLQSLNCWKPLSLEHIYNQLMKFVWSIWKSEPQTLIKGAKKSKLLLNYLIPLNKFDKSKNNKPTNRAGKEGIVIVLSVL